MLIPSVRLACFCFLLPILLPTHLTTYTRNWNRSNATLSVSGGRGFDGSTNNGSGSESAAGSRSTTSSSPSSIFKISANLVGYLNTSPACKSQVGYLSRWGPNEGAALSATVMLSAGKGW